MEKATPRLLHVTLQASALRRHVGWGLKVRRCATVRCPTGETTVVRLLGTSMASGVAGRLLMSVVRVAGRVLAHGRQGPTLTTGALLMRLVLVMRSAIRGAQETLTSSIDDRFTGPG